VVVVYKNVSKHGLLYAAKNSSECCNNWNGDVIRMDVRNEHENIVYNTDTFQTESIFFLFLLQEGVKKFWHKNTANLQVNIQEASTAGFIK